MDPFHGNRRGDENRFGVSSLPQSAALVPCSYGKQPPPPLLELPLRVVDNREPAAGPLEGEPLAGFSSRITCAGGSAQSFFGPLL